MLYRRPMITMLTLTVALLSACLPQNEVSHGSKPRRTASTAGDNTGAQSTLPPNSPNSTEAAANQGAQQSTTNPSNSPINSGINPSSNPSSNPSAPQPGNPPAPQSADCYKADVFICKIESLIAAKTNKYRASRGLQPLTPSAKMDFVARDWSVKQSQSGRISHTGFPSARNAVYRAEFQQSFRFSGENVAYTSVGGGSDQSDAAAERIAETFAVMWWNSSGHRANMLGRFGSIGVGVYKNSRGAWYATQLFK